VYDNRAPAQERKDSERKTIAICTSESK